MLATLRDRNFALLWLAGVVSLLGDWLLLIALPFHIYELTGSALATGGIFAAATLPRIALGSVAGVFVDRWDRRRTMVAADLARAALLLPLLAVVSRDWLWLAYVVAIAQAAVGQFFIPAKGAIIPRLVGEERLVAANALTALSDNLTRLIGPALGGALYATVGLSGVVLLDAATFLIGGCLIAAVAVPHGPGGGGVPPRTTLRGEWLAGLRLVARSRTLTVVFVLMGLAMVVEGFLTVLLVPFAKEVLRGGARELGLLLSAQAVGGLVGGLLIGRLGKVLPPARIIAPSSVALGLLLIGIANAGALGPAMALIAVAGVPVVGFFVGMQALLQGGTADRYRGRVFGAFGTVAALLTLAGNGAAGALGDRVGIVPLLSAAGSLDIAAGLVALAFLPGALPQRSRRDEVAAAGSGAGVSTGN